MLESVTSILCRLTVFAFGGGAMKLAILTPASFSLHTACLMRQWEGRREKRKERREGKGEKERREGSGHAATTKFSLRNEHHG